MDLVRLAELSLADLMEIEVTISSKKPEKFSDTAAATFIITAEDIRRSGATTIPEILRLAPGVNVARIDGSEWAVSMRGFSAVYSDKLLVLIDGRSVYTPLFGGIFWNEQDTLLEDIERVEVVRGPGGSLWGANATNGVINIITKHASRTGGTLVSGGGGSEEQVFLSARHGAEIGETPIRFYAKAFDRDDNHLEGGAPAHDGWRSARGGFRADSPLSKATQLTVQGDGYYGESGWDLIRPSPVTLAENLDVTRYYRGGNLLARLTNSLSEKSEWQLRFYYDLIDRDDFVLQQERHTFDFEGQLRFAPAERHDLVVGAGYRFYEDDHESSFSVGVDPDSRSLSLYNIFAQDDIELLSNRLRMILGARLEHNELSDFDFQPNIRGIVRIDERNSAWAAVSGAARNPARFNHDGRLALSAFPQDGQVALVTLRGDSGYESERLIAYELGMRSVLSEWFSVDLAGFANDYSNLESVEPAGAPFFDGENIEVPLQVENKLDGLGLGGELSLEARLIESLRLVANYSYLRLDLDRDEDSQDTIFSAGEGQTPKNQFMVRALYSPLPAWEFDSNLRFSSRIESFDVDKYAELDLRLAWKPTRNLELSLVGQNLIHPDHLEFASNLVDTARTEIDRGVYAKVTWRE